MFVKVPAIDGVPNVGKITVFESRSITATEAIAYIDSSEKMNDWVVLTDMEYLAYWSAGRISVDKQLIIANSPDSMANITVEVHPTLAEVTFFNADTGEAITTVPVDPTTHTATLQVTATTPGVIKIWAGEPTITRLNEVVITAQ